MEKFIKKFGEASLTDITEVGGKNASLGEMFQNLSSKGIMVPDGFAVTASAYRYFIESNKLDAPLQAVMAELDRNTFNNLAVTGEKARALILQADMPNDLQLAIVDAYDYAFNFKEPAVAVRSSATAEDLPDASFAGQHESYLNISGHQGVLSAVQRCFASLYTNRAIKYREDKGFAHDKVYLSVGVQQMVRSDKACSGVGFTLDPETGFRDVIHLAGIWGLGENLVQGTVVPDEFLLFKPSIRSHFIPVLQKKLGTKNKTMIYAKTDDQLSTTLNINTLPEKQHTFVLTDAEIEQLGRWALIIEDHYGKPMDIEWAKDGDSGQLFIIQARPETVHSLQSAPQFRICHLKQKGDVLTTGAAVGQMIASGTARLLQSPLEADKLKPGDILVTDTVSPDWDPILKKVSGIVTNKGGRTSHAAIIAREMGAVAIVGAENATYKIKDGSEITISCAEGKKGIVYSGKLAWEEQIIDPSLIHLPVSPKAQLIVGDPDQAFKLSFYPNYGVGLMRLEFIIANYVQVHPMALVHFEKVTDEADRTKISELTAGYADKTQYFVDKLAEGVATIAAAFYPKEVIVRMSDFKTNEYAGLTGGKYFEPEEENPMIGFRGASRYSHERYRDGFKLECAAMKKVREAMGFNNVKLMIPFCRTIVEAQKVLQTMENNGLKRVQNGLEIFVMAEIPSNVLLAEQFAQLFDGFSIGSNDLTQLTLGIDRDCALVASEFDEQNEASSQLIRLMIEKANLLHKKVGLCGQAASDSPGFARMLVEAGIDSISFNPDALLNGIAQINAAVASQPVNP